MMVPEATQQFQTLDEKLPVEKYNLKHFRTIHLARDVRRTLTNHGIQPGDIAPDFELPQVGGESLRLSDLRGKPVLLHFGSFS